MLIAALPLLALIAAPTAKRPDSIQSSRWEAARVHDARLAKPVTFSHPRIQTAAFLAELSRLTGVEIGCGARDGSGDDFLAIRLEDVPLRDVMDALPSLMFYQGAEWHWEVNGDRTPPAYGLVKPRAAQLAAGKAVEEVRKAFIDLAEALIHAANLSGKARSEFLTPFLTQIMETDKEYALGQIRDKATLHALKAMKESVSPRELDTLLNDTAVVRVPVDRLSAFGKGWVRETWKDSQPFRVLKDGTRVPMPEPTGIVFNSDWNLGVDIAPSLFVDMGFGGPSLVGGKPLDDLVVKRMERRWLGADGRVTSTAKTRKITSVGDNFDTRSLGAQLATIAERTGVQMMVRLPWVERQPADYLDLTKRATLNEVLRGFRGSPAWPLLHKWHGSILLLSNVCWFREEGIRVSWQRLKAAREDAGESALPSWRGLLTLWAGLSRNQLAHLPPPFDSSFRAVYIIGPLPSALGANPLILNQTCSERGASLAELARLRPEVAAWLQSHGMAVGGRIRARTEPTIFGQSYVLEVNQGGAWNSIFSDSLRVVRPAAPVPASRP